MCPEQTWIVRIEACRATCPAEAVRQAVRGLEFVFLLLPGGSGNWKFLGSCLELSLSGRQRLEIEFTTRLSRFSSSMRTPLGSLPGRGISIEGA